MKLYIDLWAGLGNQLFMIAAGIAYARDHKCDYVVVRVWDSWRFPANPPPRAVYWHTLFIDVPQVEKIEEAVQLYHEKDLDYHPFPEFKTDTMIHGYFQNPQYFYHHYEEVMKTLFPSPIVAYAQKLMPVTDCAFMHFRRGDYKQAGAPILPLEYYEKAVEYFDPETTFLVFIEEKELPPLKKELAESKILSKRKCLFADSKIPDYLTMIMMGKCSQGGIISNSTFCCWGAYMLCSPCSEASSLCSGPSSSSLCSGPSSSSLCSGAPLSSEASPKKQVKIIAPKGWVGAKNLDPCLESWTRI
jgi:hypothetical protein